MEKVTFLSTVEASARLISAQTAAAMRADITLGNPVCKGDVEAAAAEAARQSEAQARAEAGPGADTTDEMEGAADEDAAEADAQEGAAQKSAKWSVSRLSGLNKLKGVFKRSKPAAADQPKLLSPPMPHQRMQRQTLPPKAVRRSRQRFRQRQKLKLKRQNLLTNPKQPL